MLNPLLLLRHWDHLDIAQQEQNVDNIHYRMHFGGLSADDFDHSVRDTAESDTVSNAVAEGHHHQGEERELRSRCQPSRFPSRGTTS